MILSILLCSITLTYLINEHELTNKKTVPGSTIYFYVVSNKNEKVEKMVKNHDRLLDR